MRNPAAGVALGVVALALIAGACGGGKDPSPPTGTPTPTAPTPSPAPTEPPTPPTPAPPTPLACTYAVTADPDDFERDGGNARLTIATAAGCKWTITGDAAWAVVEGPTQGEGPALLKFSAEPNDTAQARRMTLRVADQSIPITQPGQGDCSYEVSPVVSAIPRSRWTADIGITTSRGCRWTAVSQAPWLRVNRGSGSGSGTITYEADASAIATSESQRLGVVAIRWQAPTAGQNVRIQQAGSCSAVAYGPATGGLPPTATFTRDGLGGAITVGAAGGRFHLWVLVDPVFAGCPWSVESADTWIAFESPRLSQVLTQDGDLFFTVPANPSAQPRRATLVIDGRPTTITQSGR